MNFLFKRLFGSKKRSSKIAHQFRHVSIFQIVVRFDKLRNFLSLCGLHILLMWPSKISHRAFSPVYARNHIQRDVRKRCCACFCEKRTPLRFFSPDVLKLIQTALRALPPLSCCSSNKGKRQKKEVGGLHCKRWVPSSPTWGAGSPLAAGKHYFDFFLLKSPMNSCHMKAFVFYSSMNGGIWSLKIAKTVTV